MKILWGTPIDLTRSGKLGGRRGGPMGCGWDADKGHTVSLRHPCTFVERMQVEFGESGRGSQRECSLAMKRGDLGSKTSFFIGFDPCGTRLRLRATTT